MISTATTLQGTSVLMITFRFSERERKLRTWLLSFRTLLIRLSKSGGPREHKSNRAGEGGRDGRERHTHREREFYLRCLYSIVFCCVFGTLLYLLSISSTLVTFPLSFLYKTEHCPEAYCVRERERDVWLLYLFYSSPFVLNAFWFLLVFLPALCLLFGLSVYYFPFTCISPSLFLLLSVREIVAAGLSPWLAATQTSPMKDSGKKEG